MPRFVFLIGERNEKRQEIFWSPNVGPPCELVCDCVRTNTAAHRQRQRIVLLDAGLLLFRRFMSDEKVFQESREEAHS